MEQVCHFCKFLFNRGHNYRGGKQSGVVILLCFLQYFLCGQATKKKHKCAIVVIFFYNIMYIYNCKKIVIIIAEH